VEKTREAGALYGGRKPSRWVRSLRSRVSKTARSWWRKRREGPWEERNLSQNPVEGEPRRSEAQESMRSRSGLNLRTGRGKRLIRGAKPLKRRHQAAEVWWKSAGTERFGETRSGSRMGGKLWRAKPTSVGGWKRPPRVRGGSRRWEGSQTLRAGLPGSMATLAGRFVRSEKRGASIRICWRATSFRRGAHVLGLIESTEATQNAGGEAGGKTLGWRRSAWEVQPRNENHSWGSLEPENPRVRGDPKDGRGERKLWTL